MRGRSTAVTLLALLALVKAAAGQSMALPDPASFAPVQIAGDLTTGFPAYYVGCLGNGATLQDLIVYSNDNFLRGLEVNLTDGRNVQLGCVNTTSGHTGCSPGMLDAGIRYASFRFALGELVTSLSLWAGPDDRGRPDARAGALRFVTSMGRIFDFGNKQSRDNPVNVNVASGVPCGIASRRGADIDALGFVFLQSATSSILTDVSYSGLPTNQVNGSDFQATYAVIQQQNMTYDNSNNSEAHTYVYASAFTQARPSEWSRAVGLDAYAGPNVTAGTPQLLTQGKSNAPQGWQVTPPAAHQRTEDGLQADQWSYNIPVPAGAIYNARVSLLQARISVPYTGNLTVQLADGASVSVPVQGIYQGVTYAPATVDIEVVKQGTSANASLYGTNTVNSVAPASSSSGSTNKSLAIALGVVLGFIFLAAVVAAFLIVSRRRNQKEAARKNANHIGTVHDFSGGGGRDAMAISGAAVGAGAARGFSLKNKAVKPVTPKATQAPPGTEAGQAGLWRVLPAAALANRFQHLFKGKGHAEEDLAERGLSTTSTHENAPEIPLGPEPSPTRGLDVPRRIAGTPDEPAAGAAAASKMETTPGAPKLQPNEETGGVAGSPLGRRLSSRKGSIEHEGTPIKLSGGRTWSGALASKIGSSGSGSGNVSRPPAPETPVRPEGILEHDNANIKLGQKYDGPT